MNRSRGRRKRAVHSGRANPSSRSYAELQNFARMIATDLQRPLRTILANTKALAEKSEREFDKQSRRILLRTRELTQKMYGFIQDLLSYTRIETQDAPFEPTDAEAALASAVASLKGPIRQNRARVTHDSLPTVAADPRQLTRLFQNLIINAIRFRGNGAIRIHVSARRKGGAWDFSLSANGLGFNMGNADRLFGLFQSLTAKDFDHGLELASCRKIVERHGGKIWVISEPEQGAEFHFTFPLRPPTPISWQPEFASGVFR